MTLDELITSLQHTSITTGAGSSDAAKPLSPILMLPPEIAVNIFSICVELSHTASWATLQKLSHVCSLWMTFITQTPQLWMNLSYSWYRRDYLFSKILTTHVSRSCEAPLSLSLDVTSGGRTRERIFDAVAPAFHRLRAFHFTDARYRDLAHLSRISRHNNLFPLLESLALSHDLLDEDGEADYPFDPIVLHTPVLREVTMHDIPAHFFEVTLTQARSVIWYDTEYNPNAVKNVFLQCANAEKIDIMLRGWRSPSIPSHLSALTTLPSLKTLLIEIADIQKADPSPLFQSIHTPNLRHFRVKAQKSIKGWKQHSFIQFASRSLHNLVILELSFSHPSLDMLQGIYAHCPNVEEFKADAEYQEVDLVLQSLTSGILPRLKKVQILGQSTCLTIEVLKSFLEDRWSYSKSAGHRNRVQELTIECMKAFWPWGNSIEEFREVAGPYVQQGMSIVIASK